MDTLLIVEDEKMIRRGIAVMAQRTSVKIGEIIECRNGEEAMEVLKKQKVDTVFTDIRMPKMDGIELVKEIGKLEDKPDIVVVSGYDDFNYAVEMLKQGVFDYILKPVKREKIEEILKKLEEKQKSNSQTRQAQKQMLYGQIRYYLSAGLPEEECEAIRRYWEEQFRYEPYIAVVFSDRRDEPAEIEEGFCVEHMNHEKAAYILESSHEEWKRKTGAKYYGESLPVRGFGACRDALKQAERARERAYIRGLASCVYAEDRDGYRKNEDTQRAEQFVQQFAGPGREEAVKKLLNRCFRARHGEEEGDILSFIRLIQKKLSEAYRNVIEDKEIFACEDLLLWDTLEEYETELEIWLKRLAASIEARFTTDQNKRKIQEAVNYVHENYRSDLNMAMVSNYVSMNYSLFSIEFKNYTGVNFVNYLKEIRIKEARKLLEETDLKIQEVGKMVGYENDKHFMKIFKSICGISPSEYRKMRR